MRRAILFSSLLMILGFSLRLQAQSNVSSQKQVKITLLQLNDVYQIAPVDKGKNGGLARIATLRQKILAQSPNTLFFLAGDTISPSVASTIFKGQQMIAAWNAIGLDYACLGNHEFDFGNDVLMTRMKESKFGWLGSNVIDRNTNQPFNKMPRYIIREIGGIKVGFFGLLTTDTQTSSKPGANIRFVDPVLTTRGIVPEMRAKGATIIIAITHLTMSRDKAVAATGLVDMILGGHEHEFFQSLAGHAPIFKWGADARTLGRIDLTINAVTGKLMSLDWAGIPVTDGIAEEPAAAAIIAQYESKVSAALDIAIGRTAVELDATSFANRTKETNLGNLIADAFRAATKADVAILNGGSVRANRIIPIGPLSKRDTLALLPFENPVVKLEVSGALLRAALENGVSQVVEESESGRFPQVSGLHFEFDGRQPVGTRVTKITVNGQPWEPQKLYSLAVTSYVAEGGDGYAMLKATKRLIEAESADLDATILANLIAAQDAVAPHLEGRTLRLDR